MKKKIRIQCPNCKKLFYKLVPWQLYCSQACKWIAYGNKKREEGK